MIVGRALLGLCLTAVGYGVTPLAIAAGDQAPPSTTEKMIRDTKEAVESTKQVPCSKKRAFKRRFKPNWRRCRPRSQNSKPKPAPRPWKPGATPQKALQDLERKKDEARKQLDEASHSTSSAWSSLKDNVNAAVADLKKSYKETVSKLPSLAATASLQPRPYTSLTDRWASCSSRGKIR